MQDEILRSTRHTTTVEREVRSAARAILKIKSKDFVTFYEHGQWWVEDVTTGAQWSVVDAVGGRAVNGFDFEQVTDGEE